MEAMKYFRSRLKVEGDQIFAFVPYGRFSDTIRDKNLGEFKELLFPNCFSFDDSLEIKLNHRGTPLGSIREGNLSVKSNFDGLKIRSTPSEKDRDIFDAVASGELDGCSPGFYCYKDEWRDRHGQKVRTIMKAHLDEVSLCSLPAYFSASACVNLNNRSKHKQRRAIISSDIIAFPVNDRIDWRQTRQLKV